MASSTKPASRSPAASSPAGQSARTASEGGRSRRSVRQRVRAPGRRRLRTGRGDCRQRRAAQLRGRRAHRACRRGSTRPCRSAPSPAAAACRPGAGSIPRRFRPARRPRPHRGGVRSGPTPRWRGPARCRGPRRSARWHPAPRASRSPSTASGDAQGLQVARQRMQVRSQKSTLAGASPCSFHCPGAARNNAVTVPSRAAARAGLSCARRSVRSQNSVCMGRSRA